MMASASSFLHRYVTVLRASAALRIPRDQHIQINVVQGEEQSLVTFRTRYLPFHNEPEKLPRELWVEVLGSGTDIVDAMQRAQERSNTIASALSLAMNAGADPLVVEFAFDVCTEHDDHEFFQNCLLDETGLPRLARTVDADAFLEFFGELLQHLERDRLLRSIAQYNIALGHWTPGQETLALAHLFMAMEALTPLVRDREIEKYGSRKALLGAWNIRPKVCRRCGNETGTDDLDASVRRRLLFRGEKDVYRDAKKASDGLEHGFLGFEEIHTHAVKHRDRLGFLVRHAIMNLVSESAGWREPLLAEKRDVAIPAVRMAKYIKCTLVGDSERLPPPGEQYPRFRLDSSIKSIVLGDDGAVMVEPEEALSAVLGDEIQAKDLRFEMWGPPGGQDPSPRAAGAEGPAS